MAGIAQRTMIVGSADRMLTAGDVQFEPQQSKIVALSNSIVLMMAGDASVQAEVIGRIHREITERIVARPSDWWFVRDVVDLYVRRLKEVRTSAAESTVLAPLGLTIETFRQHQKDLAPSLVSELARELINHEHPVTEAIVCGLDPTGAHLYAIHDVSMECADSVGFSAVGIGRWHANSALMFAGHTGDRLATETLFAVYDAKRRAEVAPGVGEGTDMFIIGPGLGSLAIIPPPDIHHFGRLWDQGEKRRRKELKRVEQKIARYVEQAGERARERTGTQTPPETVSGGTSPDGIRGDESA